MNTLHWKQSISLFLFGILIVLVLLLNSCRTHRPQVDVHFWAGDSEKKGISRSQDKKTIACEDAEFDNYICLDSEDVEDLYQAFMQCKSWEEEPLISYEERRI